MREMRPRRYIFGHGLQHIGMTGQRGRIGIDTNQAGRQFAQGLGNTRMLTEFLRGCSSRAVQISAAP